MSIEHPIFKAPQNPLIKIWRYMDFTKFVSMLENGGLFFSRADRLGDPFEGSFSSVIKGFDHIFATTRKIFVDKETIINPNNKPNYYKSLRKSVFINCWHMNEHESAAMWKLYTKTNESICIQSTFQKLKQCLDEKVFIGEVSYIDYEHDYMPNGNVIYPYIHKRKSFEHEHELRALIWNNKSNSKNKYGIWKKVSLKFLIEKIFIAPASPKWFLDDLKKLLIRYELKKQVKRSSLNRAPFF